MGYRGGQIGITDKVTVTVTSPARVHRACAVVTALWLLAPPYLTLHIDIDIELPKAPFKAPRGTGTLRKQSVTALRA